MKHIHAELGGYDVFRDFLGTDSRFRTIFTHDAAMPIIYGIRNHSLKEWDMGKSYYARVGRSVFKLGVVPNLTLPEFSTYEQELCDLYEIDEKFIGLKPSDEEIEEFKVLLNSFYNGYKLEENAGIPFESLLNSGNHKQNGGVSMLFSADNFVKRKDERAEIEVVSPALLKLVKAR